MSEIFYADEYQPNFGQPYPTWSESYLAELTKEELLALKSTKEQVEGNAKFEPTEWGWTLPGWELVKENWSRYKNHIILGGNRSSKSTFCARLVVDAALHIPEARIRCYSINEDRSAAEQQAMVWDALPARFKALSRHKGRAYSFGYSQRTGFTGSKVVFPPLPGASRGSEIIFTHYASYKNDPQTAEGWWSHLVWCLAEGELVQMADGTMREIQDVQVGDHVLTISKTGKPVKRRVTATQFSGEKECIMVKPRNGTPVVCTKDHDIYWGYGGESKEEAQKATRMAQIRPGEWWPDITEDRDDAWYAWAALVIAEGTVSQRKVTSGTGVVIHDAIRLLPNGAKVRRKNFKNGHVPDWFLNWPEFWDEIPAALSHEKTVPEWVFRSSPAKVRLFLRWLYQGDGWASGHRIGYATTSIKLATQVMVLLSRLGIKASMTIKKPQRKNWKEQYWVMVSKAAEALKFINEIGIQGKEHATRKVAAECRRRIKSLKTRGHKWPGNGSSRFTVRNERDKLKTSLISMKRDEGVRRVYDITVEGEHRFLCGTSLVSNCDEECPQKLFETLQYRLSDARGRLLLSFTTLQGWTPLVAELLGRTKVLDKRYAPLLKTEIPYSIESLSRASTRVYFFWTEDQRFIPVDDFVAGLKGRPREEILARAYGIPTKASESPFPAFDETVHVIPHEKVPFIGKPDYKVTRYHVIDPAGNKPWFMLWAAVDPKCIYVYNEWPGVDHGDWAEAGEGPAGKAGPGQRPMAMGIRDYIDVIAHEEEGTTIFERCIDPRLGATPTQGKEGATTIISELEDEGLTAIPAPGLDIHHGLMLINSALKYDSTQPVSATNYPKLVISDRCQNLIFALKNYTALGGKDEATKDPIDCLRYLLTNGCDFIDQADYRKTRTWSYG